jgi:transposase
MLAMTGAMTAEKKIKGRKRHIVVDIMEFLLAVVTHAANIHDTKAGCLPAAKAFDKYPTIEKFSGDEGYRGSFEEYVSWDFDDVGVDISKRIKPEFEILPKRWIVERTLAWFGHSRRLSKYYEISTNSAENMAVISNLHTILKRYWS